MLRNLKEIFKSQEDWSRLIAVQNRLIVLLPKVWADPVIAAWPMRPSATPSWLWPTWKLTYNMPTRPSTCRPLPCEWLSCAAPSTDGGRSANELELEMKAVFTLVGLLIVVAAIGFLSKKQMASIMPTGLPPEISTQGSVPAALTNSQPQQLPEQFKKAVNDAMQKPRAEDDSK